MAVASLAVTKSYADGNFLTEAILDTAFQSIQTYTNTYVKNNFDQLRKDCFSATAAQYDFDNDGVANRTYNLFNKQVQVYTYATGIVLSTATFSGFVDIANASFSFTPEKAGWYRFVGQTNVDIAGKVGVSDTVNAKWILKVKPTGGSATYSVPHCSEWVWETTDKNGVYSPRCELLLNCSATPYRVGFQYALSKVASGTLATHRTFSYNATNKEKLYLSAEKI